MTYFYKEKKFKVITLRKPEKCMSLSKILRSFFCFGDFSYLCVCVFGKTENFNTQTKLKILNLSKLAIPSHLKINPYIFGLPKR